MDLLCRIQPVLPRLSLFTIYETFIRSIYDQSYNSSFHEKLESLQDIACLAITWVIRGLYFESIYHNLALRFF